MTGIHRALRLSNECCQWLGVKLLRATSQGAAEYIDQPSGSGFLTDAIDQLALRLVMDTAQSCNSSLQGGG